jgi:hypothetical protein
MDLELERHKQTTRWQTILEFDQEEDEKTLLAFKTK